MMDTDDISMELYTNNTTKGNYLYLLVFFYLFLVLYCVYYYQQRVRVKPIIWKYNSH